MDKLDGREKRLSFAGSGASAAFGILIYLEETHNHNFHLAKNELAPEWTLILGIAAGVLLLGATLLGRRAPVGFVALFTGAMFTGSSLIFGLPFIALALWLLYHSYKIQKETAAKVRRRGPSRADRGQPRERRRRRREEPEGRGEPARPRARRPAARKRRTRGRPGPRPTSASPPSDPRRRLRSPPAGSARRRSRQTERAGRPGLRGVGHQSRPEELQDLVATAHQGPRRGLLAEGA